VLGDLMTALFFFARLLCSHVVSNSATGDSAKYGMVMGVMARHSADQRTLKAPGRLGGCSER
jgi:hypothetical protein